MSLYKQETERTGQWQGQDTWLTIHQRRRKEINQLKKALKDLVVFTDHHRGARHHPQPVPLHWCRDM